MPKSPHPEMPAPERLLPEQPGTALTGVDMSTEADLERRGDQRAQISNAMVALKKRFYGKGPERARSYVMDDYVFCALMHDIGDLLGSLDHAGIGAAIVKPFVSERNHWMVDKHAIFQGYYFFHHLGLDRDMREQFRGHEWFDHTAEFCEDFDQPAFDPGYDTLPLEHFEPLVRDIMAKPRRSIYLRS